MARARTCFASSVVCTDEFRDLPESARLLYFELGFSADNDGAVDGIRGVCRMAGAKPEDMDTLTAAGYLLWVDGVPFITHWKVNNKADRLNYRSGGHPEQLSKLNRESGKPYTLADCCQTDVRLTSVANISKDNLIESNLIEANPIQTNQNETNQNALQRIRCPSCSIERAATIDPDGSLRSWCPECDIEFTE